MVPLSTATAIAHRAHRGQTRADGSAYIEHPLAVARILMEASTHLPTELYAAALLHDVIEDTAVTFEALRAKVGPTIAMIVLGLTRPRKLVGEEDNDWDRRYLNQMASMEDISPGILLIKMADRIHNIETSGLLPPHRSHLLSIATRDVYVPFFGEQRNTQPPEWRSAYDHLLQRLAALLCIAHHPL